MAQSMRRLIHTAILVVVALLFTVTVQQALAALTAEQEASTLRFLQEFPRQITDLEATWTGTNYCSWDGITCAENGYVSIDLSSRGLTGDMPEVPSGAVGSDVMVVVIDMSNNTGWQGNFDDSWGALSNLRYLDLSRTGLRNDIPDAWNGMTSLVIAKIAGTYTCRNMPNWNIATLQTLDLSDNAFRGSLPPSWGSMANLHDVNLAGTNPCGCVPATWTSTALRSAAAAIGNGVADADCAAANSCDHRTNHCLRYSAATAQLSLAERHTLAFLQRFPRELSYLRDRWTGIDYCSWEGVSCDASGDVSVNLAGKGLTGDMPDIDSDVDGWLVRVVSIDMSNNPDWRDSFQQDWRELQHLRYLNLSRTGLHDRIPDDWTDMKALQEVYIHDTAACTSLPDWSNAALRIVDLSNNHIRGSLSADWSQMTGLRTVTLSGNQFCGCVPATWTAAVLRDAVSGTAAAASDCATANVCTLDGLQCHDTAASSTSAAPADTTSATLRFLQRFPREISYLRDRWTGTTYCSWEGVSCDANGYVSINLAGKGLTGNMPEIDDNIDGTQIMVVSIDMSNNVNWRDDFEDDWARLRNLQHLDLSNTGLHGNIPDAWNGMTALQTIKITNTGACRGLPNWNIASLRTVDLSNNLMRGALANSWGSMTNLQSVTLTGNQFCGCVPATWTSTVLRNAASAIGGNLVAANCGASNSCRNANSCSRNAAAAPAHATAAVLVGVVSALLAVLAL